MIRYESNDCSGMAGVGVPGMRLADRLRGSLALRRIAQQCLYEITQ